MTAISAPPMAASAAQKSAPQAAAGNNALPGNDGIAADFASILASLQQLAGTQPAEVAALTEAPSFAAVIQELKPELDDKEVSEDEQGGVNIAAILGQINPQPIAQPLVPALNTAAMNQNEAFARPGSNDAPDNRPNGLDIAVIATAGKKPDEAPGLAKKETVEFSLPETAASAANLAHGIDAGKAHLARSETAKLDVATPVHSPNWSAEVGQRVVWMAKNDVQEAQLSVNPPHLGPIEITLSLKDDNATAHFSSPHAEVRAALEEALPRLREMLAGAGVQLGQSDVGAQSQQAFQQFSGKQNGAFNGQPTFNDEHPSLQAQNAVNQSVVARTLKGNGLVDTFV